MKTIIIIGTLDTKEAEVFYLKKEIEQKGYNVLIVDISTMPYNPILGKVNITQQDVAKASGTSIKNVYRMSRYTASEVMKKGLTNILKRLCEEGNVHGAIGLGGSFGATVIVSALKELPISFPKCIVTTGGRGAIMFSEGKDIVVVPSVVDLSGGKTINYFEAKILAKAAGVITGMVEARIPEKTEKALILATQMGVTTPCMLRCKSFFIKRGFDMVIFHAIGTGGKNFEAFIEAGFAKGVLDVTLAEISNELLGGVCVAGSKRLTTAGIKGVPQIVCPGALDMVNFLGPGTVNVPHRFKNRQFYFHNPMVTLMRVEKEESVRLGKIIAKRLNKATGPTVMVIPLKGWSAYDVPDGVRTVDYYGKPSSKTWHNPESNAAFIKTVESYLNLNKPNIDLIKVDKHINDPDFAELIAGMLLDMISS
ncbi:MAG: Tm-1-like ATP-binding domain-containing protein [Candidatus Baldrarchaeia archaeon]